MATQKQKEKALERAAKAQEKYWDAMKALEDALGYEIDEPGDLGELSAYTVAELDEKFGDPSDDDDDFFYVGKPESCKFCKNLGHACIDHEEEERKARAEAAGEERTRVGNTPSA